MTFRTTFRSKVVFSLVEKSWIKTEDNVRARVIDLINEIGENLQTICKTRGSRFVTMPSRLRIERDASRLSNLAKGIRSTARRAALCVGSCALVFVEYEVTYRIHYRTGIRSMHAKVEKQAQLKPATLGEREGRTIGRTGERAGG